MKFKIGMRTIKTGISVFICILLSFVFHRETYVVSSITAVFTLREDMQTTLKYGKHRVGGNVIGALFSLVVITIFKLLGDSEVIQLFCIPLVIVLMITILSALDVHEGTVGACATLLTILFMIPNHQSYSYAIDRVVDSFIGMSVALMINFLLPNTKAAEACQKVDED